MVVGGVLQGGEEMSESFSEAYGKILNKIHELEGTLLDSKECSDMEYLVNCAMRMHKVGDERGGWDLLCKVGGEVPGIKVVGKEQKSSAS